MNLSFSVQLSESKSNTFKLITSDIPYNFHDGGTYYIETSPLVCFANQLTGFYMIGASAVRDLMM